VQTVKKPPVSGFPWYPKTLGQHLLKKRLELGLTQVEVARKLNLGLQTISHWESEDNIPNIYHYPAIISFLGYYPFRVDETEGGKIIKYRYERGLSKKKLARFLKTHVKNIDLWEANSSELNKMILANIGL
jgi:DNA-binding transcriptional regulator YiaG